MIGRTVETAVKLGRFCKRGTADGQVVPATDGSAQSFPVFGEAADVDADVEIAAGKQVDIGLGDEPRDLYLVLADTVTEFGLLMPTTGGAAVPATDGNYYGAIALKSGVSGDIIPVRARQGYLETT